MASHEGGCHCGAIRYRIEEPAKFSSLCHCRSCQRSSGTPVSAFVGVFEVQSEETKGCRAIYLSSPGVRRGFCQICGTSLTFAGENWPGEIHIYTATLDDPEAFAPKVHTMMDDNITWFHTADDLPRLGSFAAKPKD